MITLTVIAVSIAVLAAAEYAAVAARAAGSVARWSARLRYDDPERAAIRAEELSALLEQQAWNLLKLATALRFACAAVRVRAHRTVAGLYEQMAAVTADGRVVVKKMAVVAVAGGMALTAGVIAESALSGTPGGIEAGSGSVQGAVPDLDAALLPASALPGFQAEPAVTDLSFAELAAVCPAAGASQSAASAEATESFGASGSAGPDISETLLQSPPSAAGRLLTQLADTARVCEAFTLNVDGATLRVGMAREAFPVYGDGTVALRITVEMMGNSTVFDSDLVAVRHGGTVMLITATAPRLKPGLTRSAIAAAYARVTVLRATAAASRAHLAQISQTQWIITGVLVPSVAEAAIAVLASNASSALARTASAVSSSQALGPGAP
jgi:hypothetical protein